MDLDAYFARISYAGARDASLATLRGIVAAHVQAIPFENLDVLLGRPIALDEQAIVQKLVHDRRGGYCFEQNGLLLAVLEALGFRVKPISARVRLQRPRDFIPPRTHAFLRVELEGESWLADVGVGGLSPSSPLRLNVEGEQPTLHEPRRIVREEGKLFHQVLLGSEWSDVCEFTLEEMPFIDRELANWFTSAHPQSHFRNRLLVARAEPEGARRTLLNQELSFRGADGHAAKRTLGSYEELIDVLATDFSLRLPPGARIVCSALPW